MSETAHTISVVIPFGKLEGNIVRCVSSALRQDAAALEVLAVANHVVTVDMARHKLAELLGDNRLRVVDGSACRNANDARNLGATMGRGTWIALLDSDDWWDQDHLSGCLRVAEANDPSSLDLVYGSITVHGADGSGVEVPAHHYSAEGTPENYLLSYYPAQTSSYLVRRQAMLEEPWAPHLRRHQDYEWFARIARRNRVAVNLRATVHVEWTERRKHKAHRDCWSVMSGWRPLVHRKAFRHHHRNLAKSALICRDPFALQLGLLYALDIFRPASSFLREPAVRRPSATR